MAGETADDRCQADLAARAFSTETLDFVFGTLQEGKLPVLVTPKEIAPGVAPTTSSRAADSRLLCYNLGV